ncbi:hypothetical protein KVA01_09030 [Kocuria varians]|uniref:Uncharacterized protein n=1 Tax=Kocuria varians TaxID=1272 RepID=A0A4Y4D0P9_KOCVA|nr:hypothetical protein KVA01_09030 [Kocuria varians]
MPWLLAVGVGMPMEETMPTTCCSGRVARMALPTPVSCTCARLPTSVNMRMDWEDCAWPT